MNAALESIIEDIKEIILEGLETIINHLRACDEEIVELCARPMHIERQRDLSILDDYEYVLATDYLTDGFKNPQ